MSTWYRHPAAAARSVSRAWYQVTPGQPARPRGGLRMTPKCPSRPASNPSRARRAATQHGGSQTPSDVALISGKADGAPCQRQDRSSGIADCGARRRFPRRRPNGFSFTPSNEQPAGPFSHPVRGNSGIKLPHPQAGMAAHCCAGGPCGRVHAQQGPEVGTMISCMPAGSRFLTGA